MTAARRAQAGGERPSFPAHGIATLEACHVDPARGLDCWSEPAQRVDDMSAPRALFLIDVQLHPPQPSRFALLLAFGTLLHERRALTLKQAQTLDAPSGNETIPATLSAARRSCSAARRKAGSSYAAHSTGSSG
jgi:hypothetical protein